MRKVEERDSRCIGLSVLLFHVYVTETKYSTKDVNLQVSSKFPCLKSKKEARLGERASKGGSYVIAICNKLCSLLQLHYSTDFI